MLKDLTYCKECFVEHAENCRTCFGFGLTLYDTPISASEAMERSEQGEGGFDFVACPVCKGTPFGMHEEVVA